MGALLSSGEGEEDEGATEKKAPPLTPRSEQLLRATNVMHDEITSLAVTIQQLFGDAAVWIMRIPSAPRKRRPLENLNIDALIRRTQSLSYQLDGLLRRYGDAYPHLFFLDRALDTLSVVIVGKYNPVGHERVRYTPRWIRAEGMPTRHQVIDLLETCLKGLAAVTEMSEPELRQMRDTSDLRSWINMARTQLTSLRRLGLQDAFDRALVPILLDTVEAMLNELSAHPIAAARPAEQPALLPLVSSRGGGGGGMKRSQSTASVVGAGSRRINLSGKALTITTASRRTQSEAALRPIKEEDHSPPTPSPSVTTAAM